MCVRVHELQSHSCRLIALTRASGGLPVPASKENKTLTDIQYTQIHTATHRTTDKTRNTYTPHTLLSLGIGSFTGRRQLLSCTDSFDIAPTHTHSSTRPVLCKPRLRTAGSHCYRISAVSAFSS